MSKDPYYSRKEVSNSDLTALKMRLYPGLNHLTPQQLQKAFHLGTLVDGLVTEPKNCNHYRKTVGEEKYTPEEWQWGKKMLGALRKRATKDAFLAYVLENAETQRVFTNERQRFEYDCFEFELATRCKFDWYLGGWGGDLKTTSATTQMQFEQQIDWVDWDRSRVYYDLILNSINPTWGKQDFIYAVSKKNFKVFFKKILWGDEVFQRGLEKVNELAFRYWMLT